MKKENPHEMTIVIVNDFDYVQGGASKVAIDTARLLHDNGYRVIFFSATHSSSKYVDYGYENVTLNLPECLHDKNKIRGILYGLYHFQAKKELRRLLLTLDKEKTIIHYHGWTKSLSSSVFHVAFQMHFKTILTLHDYFSACPNGGFFHYSKNQSCTVNGCSLSCMMKNCDSRNYFFKLYRIIRQWIQNKIVRLPKRIGNLISISDFSWNQLESYFPQNIECRKIPNPIFISSKDIPKRTSVGDYYLYVGRISKEKGVDIFCQAICDCSFRGIVVGNGPDFSALKAKYPNIEFVGWKSQEEVKKYLSHAKAFVFSSLCYETMGMSALEALAMGVPILVGDNCATREYVEHGQNGFLYKNGDVTDLKRKLQEFEKSDISLLHSNAYHSYWDSPFTQEAYLEQLLEYYAFLIHKR